MVHAKFDETEKEQEYINTVKRLLNPHRPYLKIGKVKLGAGRTNDNLLVYDTDSKPVCVVRKSRLDRTNMAHFYFLQIQSLEREKFLLEYIGKHAPKVPIPRLIAADQDPEDGLDYLVVSHISGINFADIAGSLTPNQYNNYMRNLGETIAPVSNLTFGSFGIIGPDGIIINPFQRWSDRIAFSIYGKLKDPASTEYFTHELLFEKIPEFIEKHREALDKNRRPTAVLYDLHSKNFNVDPTTEKITGFFDIGLGLIANRTLEFVPIELNTVNFGKTERPAALEAFFEGYGLSLKDRADYEAAKPVYALNHSLGAVLAYHNNPVDDLRRDLWSREVFKPRVEEIVEKGIVNMVRWF
ncbi:MAG TPA: aminoglycoside phosphotransferase family protein [Candidatus Nanoarchaeia archaeon]|nr:aminoglycoside phosphotransferase family protein [Candidatus Nanoarchaeia archaeon]